MSSGWEGIEDAVFEISVDSEKFNSREPLEVWEISRLAVGAGLGHHSERC